MARAIKAIKIWEGFLGARVSQASISRPVHGARRAELWGPGGGRGTQGGPAAAPPLRKSASLQGRVPRPGWALRST